MKLCVVIAALGFVAPVQAMQQPAPPNGRESSTTAIAHKATQPPVIDGKGADAIWQAARKISDFRQFQPRENSDPSFRTEFQVAFDEHNLFVFVRAFDPHPDSIMHALTRRDVRGPSDQIIVFIDSYNDKRTGFDFNVNPDGVKRDYSIFNDGEENGSWNAVWDVATQVDSLGWTAEFRIPLSQLRFADADTHTFGFGVWRDIERYNERVSWPVFQRTRNGLVSQLGTLDGIAGISSPARLELTPYTVTKNVSRAKTAGGFERDQKVALGGDLKYGITPNVTLDATVNPDFGQVEADPSVLNLSAFETFLSERRPFFVEGTGFYKFALNCYIVVDCNTNEGLFYSRRIGRSPSLLNDYGDATTPTATPIAAAGKLTGRTRSGLSFGLLDAVTPDVTGVADKTVEPGTNYAVLRAQQDLRGGQAGISWIATAVNRSLDEWTRPALHASAYVTGASFRNRFRNGQYELTGSITASRVSGDRRVIANTQRNSTHYYQQPGDDYVVDTMRTSLDGHAEQIKFGKYGGGITRFETSLVRQSAGFDVNDLGYLRRADILDWSTWAAINFNTPRWIYRTLRFNGNHWEHWTTSGMRLENALNFNAHMDLKNNWNLHAGGTVGALTESYCDRCTRGGPPLRDSRGLYPWFGINGDNRKLIIPGVWGNLSRSNEGKSHSVNLGPYLNFRVSTSFTAELGANFNSAVEDAQWFGNFVDANNVTHYSFAHLEQETRSMSLRLNYTARPNLTFEFYGSPFIAKGTYTDFRELSATPDADSFDARFQPYTPPATRDRGFNVTELRTNAVMRWEYRPGSTLFLVWAHGREDYIGSESRASWGTQYRDLFDLHPDNTFLIKVAYWLNR